MFFSYDVEGHFLCKRLSTCDPRWCPQQLPKLLEGVSVQWRKIWNFKFSVFQPLVLTLTIDHYSHILSNDRTKYDCISQRSRSYRTFTLKELRGKKIIWLKGQNIFPIEKINFLIDQSVTFALPQFELLEFHHTRHQLFPHFQLNARSVPQD